MYLQTVKIIISYEGGERVNHAILMSSGAENIDFMIHGIVQYEIFGHKVWITTSHVCILIVMLLMMALAIAGNRAIKHAKEIPGGFQNVIELMVEMLDNMVNGTMGKVAAPKFVNYISTIFSATVLSVNLFCHFKNVGKSRQGSHDKQWDHDPEHIIFPADPCTKQSAHHDRNDHIQSKLQDQCQCLKYLSVFSHLHRSSIKYNLYSL